MRTIRQLLMAVMTLAVVSCGSGSLTAPYLVALWRAENHGAPLAAIVIKSGKRVFSYAAGTDYSRQHVRISLDGPIRIGSVSKVITSYLTERSARAHHLNFDAPIGLLLGRACAARPKLSIETLLMQTSGLVDRPGSTNARQIVEDGCAAAQAHAGTWKYENVNYIGAGLIAEALDHRPLQDQFHDAFPDISRCYYCAPGVPKGSVAQRLPDTTTDQLSRAYGAGGVVCSIYSLAEIGRRLNQWLASEHSGWTTVKPMTSYGHGMYRYDIGVRPTFVHDGLIDGSSAAMLLRPESETVVVLISPTRADLSRLALSLAEVLRDS